jgi:tetratricopeptide (TPR) repeat protein
MRLRLMDREAALHALERARELGPTPEGLLDLALARHLAGDVGGEVSACHDATLLDPENAEAWIRYAHALARTDRVSEAIAASERALALAPDDEVTALLTHLREIEARVLPESAAA